MRIGKVPLSVMLSAVLLGCSEALLPAPDLLLMPGVQSASYTTLSTPAGTLYGVDNEYYPAAGSPVDAVIFNQATSVGVSCDYYECLASYSLHHKGYFHETSQSLDYRVYDPVTDDTFASDPDQYYSSWQWFTAVYGSKQMTKSYPVTNLPRCNVRATGNTDHKAWWGKNISFGGGGVSINNVGVFGLVAVNSVASPVSSSECPPLIENPCDSPYTEEIEIECSSGSGPIVAGGPGTTESPGEPHSGGQNSVWVCNVTYWYQSDDSGATWYYTGDYDIGACWLEAR
jgi:hypothetical protein